jgi:hypothetical protein
MHKPRGAGWCLPACTTPRIASCTRVCEIACSGPTKSTPTPTLLLMLITRELSYILWSVCEAFCSKTLAAARALPGPLVWTTLFTDRGLTGICYNCRGTEVRLLETRHSSFLVTTCARLSHLIKNSVNMHEYSTSLCRSQFDLRPRRERKGLTSAV